MKKKRDKRRKTEMKRRKIRIKKMIMKWSKKYWPLITKKMNQYRSKSAID